HATARTAHGHTDRVDVVTGTWTTHPSPALDTLDAVDAVLIRPDGYVAWTSPGTTDDLTQALDRWFGTARRAL
ncbi:monooxygenase, partial [Streptomyces carpinensis]